MKKRATLPPRYLSEFQANRDQENLLIFIKAGAGTGRGARHLFLMAAAGLARQTLALVSHRRWRGFSYERPAIEETKSLRVS
jgi:Holliday junction resolvasome RuvABC ATP-dependent DNA helicase subunit